MRSQDYEGLLSFALLESSIIANFISIAILSVFHSFTNSTDRSMKERMLSNKQEAETHIVLEILGSIAGGRKKDMCGQREPMCHILYLSAVL